MNYRINLKNIKSKNIYPLGEKFYGKNPNGNTLEFTNYYMLENGEPYFAVSGEMHFARIREDEWEDSIIKAKMGGVNIVSTYVFWIVHEEIQGKFRFDGNRNIRKFVSLCNKHNMKVIIRIGPFAHGEMRNGGIPDWLYGMPFEIRTNSEGYLFYVRRFFSELNKQLNGLYYNCGGPIIATQIENEYMSSAAGWEITAGTSNEFLNRGSDGISHMKLLKKIAIEKGIITPFYTATAWGNTVTDISEFLPLWGGYAYWPWLWLFDDNISSHPLTPEYIYRDNHNNQVPKTYNFEPDFKPELCPFSCCEMMGGMFNSYQYRFVLPFESVDALANVKLGSGCNFLGYYMYRGGTNPLGENVPFLNENYTPKRSYDFQAPIGENGQPRTSYFRLKLLHYFCQSFSKLLCNTKTVLPDNLKNCEPGDLDNLRYCVRITDNRGFLFVNNFQDHAKMTPICDASVKLQLSNDDLTFPKFGLASGENAILPFNIPLFGATLKCATAQPITGISAAKTETLFFFTPKGMEPIYVFDSLTVKSIHGCDISLNDSDVICRPLPNTSSEFTVETATETFKIITLTRADSLKFSKLSVNGEEYAFLCDGTLLWDEKTLKIESRNPDINILAYPNNILDKYNGFEITPVSHKSLSAFKGCRISRKNNCTVINVKSVGNNRYILDIPQAELQNHKLTEILIDYVGDIGHLFINGELISDNYCNGTTWISRIDDRFSELQNAPLTLYITPLRENAKITSDSMAARFETAENTLASLKKVTLRTVDDFEIPLQ